MTTLLPQQVLLMFVAGLAFGGAVGWCAALMGPCSNRPTWMLWVPAACALVGGALVLWVAA